MKKEKSSLEKKILTYTLTASGVLGLATNALAAVHYFGLKNWIVNKDNNTINIDLNNDGTTDFNIYYTYPSSYPWIYINPSNGSWIDGKDYVDPARLPAGYNIKATLLNSKYEWDNEGDDTLAYPSSTGGYFKGQRGYIGVRFHSENCQGNSWNYGWIQFEATADSTEGRIIDWAYEDECDKPIKAGDKGEPVSVPLMGGAGVAGLGALLGAAGLSALRKKKEKEEE